MAAKPQPPRARKKRVRSEKPKYRKDVDDPKYGEVREKPARKGDIAIGYYDAETLPQAEVDDTRVKAKRRKNSSRRFKRYWATLTNAQKAALRMVYTHNPGRLTKAEVARTLGIRVDKLQERIDYAVKKLLKHFPEFDDVDPANEK